MAMRFVLCTVALLLMSRPVGAAPMNIEIEKTLDGMQLRAAQLGLEELMKHCDRLKKAECACLRSPETRTVLELRPLRKAVLVLAYPEADCIAGIKHFGVALRVERTTGKVLDSEFGLLVDRVWKSND